MGISIRQFGRHGRDMVGVRMQAETSTTARYLLCRPLGQEAVRTAAVYRVLADRLAREGCDTLRFDYHGTGDSPGEESGQGLDGWVDDTVAAHLELQGDSTLPVHWFGMGLGANIALRAALRAQRPPTTLVLWEPVLNGPAYVEALFQGHRKELLNMFREPWDRLLMQGRVSEPTLPGDLLGFDLGPALSQDLQAMGPLNPLPALRRGLRVICAVHANEVDQLPRTSSDALQVHVVEQRIDWMSSQAMGTAIVPPDIPRVLLATLRPSHD